MSHEIGLLRNEFDHLFANILGHICDTLDGVLLLPEHEKALFS
jgi:hypothetical protein